MSQAYCAKCNNKTNSHYFVRQLGILCGNCAEEHGKQLIEEKQKIIDKLQVDISSINKEIREAIQIDCNHEFEDTQYWMRISEGMQEIYKCLKCGMEDRRLFHRFKE